MNNRLRMLKAATALLYFGALLAGLVGQGWFMVLLFLAVFVVWSVTVRPQLWPPTLADICQPGAVVAMAALIATQALLVILCFAVGRGIGGVLGFKPALPFWLPLALSFLSVPVSRLIWSPQVMAENVGFDPLLHLPDAQQGGQVEEGAALPDSVTGPEMKQPVSAVSTQGGTRAQTPVSSRNDP